MANGLCANIYGEAIQRVVGHWMQKHRGAARGRIQNAHLEGIASEHILTAYKSSQ